MAAARPAIDRHLRRSPRPTRVFKTPPAAQPFLAPMRALPETRPGPLPARRVPAPWASPSHELSIATPTRPEVAAALSLWHDREALAIATGGRAASPRRSRSLLVAAAAVAAVAVLAWGAYRVAASSSDSEPAARPDPREAGTPLAGAAEPAPLAPPSDPVASLLAQPEAFVVAHARHDIEVFDHPEGGSPVRVLTHPTENGSPLVFLVERTAESGAWLEVQLPVRPNGSTGWIRARDAELRTHGFRITVDVTERRFRLYDGGELVMEKPVAIGTQETPTPGGVFYIKELLQPPDPNTVYGPYAFGLSGFSNVLESFAGGEGVIGIHGTDDPDAIGNEASKGCIRLSNEDITDLVGILPLGTPVEIVA